MRLFPLSISFIFYLLAAFVPNVHAHSGRIDDNGGHWDRKTATYHFHKGPLAEQSFPSKKVAVAALQAALQDNPPFPMQTITVASWNMHNLAYRGKETKLGIINLILSRYDLIVLQEVGKPKVIDHLQKALQEVFQLPYKQKVATVGKGKKERYAFLWRSDKITLLKGPELYPDPNDLFERTPYCGYFKVGSFDWGLCTAHILYGKKKEDRRKEVRQLSQVYRYYRNLINDEDVIFCGDFNLPPDDPAWHKFIKEDGMKYAISHPVVTTFKGKNLYDNCFWPNSTVEILPNSGQVFKFDQLIASPKSLSDHRPISITLKIPAAPLPKND